MRSILIVFLVVSLVACSNNEIESPDCENLKVGISMEDEVKIKNEIEKLTSDLKPIPTTEDDLGHSTNLYKLMDRLNSNCETITATLSCYACVYTTPAISEIRVEFELDGNLVVAIIDILTPKDDILRYGGISLTD